MSLTWKIIFLVLAIALPSFLLLILFETVLKKSLGLGEPIVYDESSIWGYSPRPQRLYNRFDGDIVTINDVGLRSTQSWLNNKNRKVLFLGDSVTYGGSYINDDQLFSILACNGLKGWACFNGGVNAYGILNMVTRSRFDTRIADADIVVFIFIWADFQRGLEDSNTAHYIVREPPNYFSATWEVLNYVSARYAPLLIFGKRADRKNEELNNPLSVASFAYENLKSEVKRLRSLDKEVILISSPSVSEILGNRDSWVENIESQFVNDFPDSYYSLLSKRLIDTYSDNRLIFRDNVHLEQKGHYLYGELIHNILANHLE